MNIVWIVADTFRQDHLGCYGNPEIRTPCLDALAQQSVRFDRHYAAGFPTMPTRANHHTGRWLLTRFGWQALPDDAVTLAQLLAEAGFHTAAVADTPFYWRNGMNYDRGFQSFFPVLGQGGPRGRFIPDPSPHEWKDVNAWWRRESDRCAPRTLTLAGDWLERHYQEDFFLYIDTWDPHEPWDAPEYYARMYMPEHDGEVINPFYGRVEDEPGFTMDRLRKAHASYCGEVTMVDAWIGVFLRKLENMGLLDNTAVIFTSDHGFYFGEHGGMFGKANLATRPDGALYRHGDKDAPWGFSPIYEEVAKIPLLLRIPGVSAGQYSGLTSAIDVMPTVLDLAQIAIPEWVEGQSLLPKTTGQTAHGRDFVLTAEPMASPGDRVRSVDDIGRPLGDWQVITVTTQEWSLLYSPERGKSQLFHLPSDPGQTCNRISQDRHVANELHRHLLEFMDAVDAPPHLKEPRSQLEI